MSTSGHGEKLSRRQELAILALISESYIGSAAQKAGIAKKTLWRWLQTESFREAYRRTRGEVVRHAMAQIMAAMTTAIDSLCQVMGDTEAPASARVSAAKAVLDFGLKASELEDLDARVAKLEWNITGYRQMP